MASLKLDKEHFQKKSSTYFLSSGGQTTKARGLAFLHLLGRYIVILSTKDKQWKLEAGDFPQGWANLAITWKNDGLLKMYVNGKEVSSGKAMSVSRPKDQYTSFEIGRPNNSHSPNFRVPLEVDNIALWEKSLSSKEISVLAKKGMDILSKLLLSSFFLSTGLNSTSEVRRSSLPDYIFSPTLLALVNIM